MTTIKRHHSPSFKASVALEAIKEIDSITTICSRHGIHPTQANRWKQQALTGLATIFSDAPVRDLEAKDALIEQLYTQIGKLQTELNWLKKRLAPPQADRRSLLDPSHPTIPLTRQCELLGLPRSTAYYHPRPEPPENLALMRRLDELYTEHPYYGSPRMTAQLQREGYPVNHKRVERLMTLMGLTALFPKKKTSLASAGHSVYPYLLRGLPITYPNQVWGTDLTYIRAKEQWFYLVAILDWFSRYVLAWRLASTATVDLCLTALTDALRIATPDIHNSDQGSQFTSAAYTDFLRDHDVRISMDGRGRCFDNIFTERLWRTVKYEEVYLHDYQDFRDAEQSLTRYFRTYNHRRLHQALGYQTPAEVYFHHQSTLVPSHPTLSLQLTH